MALLVRSKLATSFFGNSRAQAKSTLLRGSRTPKMATNAALTVHVKGDPSTSTLLDCPFCHRVLLTLEAKAVPYQLSYIDFKNKPAWLLEKAGGKVPAIEQGDMIMPDSDKIVVYLEEQYPEPSMKSDVPPEVGAKLFGSFREFLFSQPADAAEKEATLLKELKIVNDYLSAKGPLFGGDSMNATDAALGPRLYHLTVALKHYKNWSVPEDMPAITKYMETIKQLPAWKACDYGEDKIIKGWANHH